MTGGSGIGQASSNRNDVSFEVLWMRDTAECHDEVTQIWVTEAGLSPEEAGRRMKELVIAMKDPNGRIVGVSTAYKTYIQRLRSHLFACRLFIVPAYRGAGLAPSLLVATRDHLESVHQYDQVDPAIGLITLVENETVRVQRNDAVWPNSRMVYIGNSKEGYPIRVYYFKGARISP